MSRILVRYFAAAAEAAGCEEEHVEATTLGEAKDALLTAHPALEPVIAKGTFLVDGIASRDPDRQAAELHIRVALMNRFNTLGTAETERVA